MDQRGFNNPYIEAKAAARLLDVKVATLYSYVSRGLVRSVAGKDARERLYAREDIERLRERHDARAGHAPVAAAALRWGEPVLETTIGELAADGPRYRGRSALALARAGTSFERVAELLWTGRDAAPPPFHAAGFGLPAPALAACIPADGRALTALTLVVPALGSRDADRFESTPDAELSRARVLVKRLAAAVALPRGVAAARRALAAPGVAGTLAFALGARPSPRVLRAVDRALVLGAEHELNVSTFAARVVASTGADLYACVAGALAALSGPRHGGACDRIEALVLLAGRPERAAAVLRERARLGEDVPGFGHPAYPGGDPRTAPLLEAAQELAPRSAPLRTTLALVHAMRAAGREGPTIDLGLVALAQALGAPPGSATALFAIGRLAGWIAHILEQRERGVLLRPRSLYVGAPAPRGL